VGLHQTGYAYRRHAGNATTQYTANLLRFEEERRLYELLARAAASRRWGEAARVARQQTMIKLHLGYCLLADLIRGNWRLAARKLALLGEMLG
jgi:hypothetical protein